MIIKWIKVLVLGIALIGLSACDEETDGAGATSASVAKLSKEERKAIRKEIRMTQRELTKVMRAAKDFKLSDEASKLGDEVGEAYFALRDFKNDHPKMKEANARSVDANEKLQEAIRTNDQASKDKWAQVVANHFVENQQILNGIPEYKALEKKHLELETRYNKMRTDEQKKIPGAKPLMEKIEDLQKKLAR